MAKQCLLITYILSYAIYKNKNVSEYSLESHKNRYFSSAERR